MTTVLRLTLILLILDYSPNDYNLIYTIIKIKCFILNYILIPNSVTEALVSIMIINKRNIINL